MPYKLISASAEGDVALVNKLLATGYDSNQEIFGVTALTKAAAHDRSEVVKLLIRKGANVNQKVGNSTALLAAVERGSANAAELLLNAGASINLVDPTYALITAVQERQLEVIKLLFNEKYSYINKKNIFGVTLINGCSES